MFEKSFSNQILAALPAEEICKLIPLMRPLPLQQNKQLQSSGDVIETVYFPAGGLVSEKITMSDGTSFEVMMIGREGVVGVSALFGIELSRHEAVVQITGAAWAVNAAQLRGLMANCPVLRAELTGYITSSFDSVAKLAACTGRHSIPERCATKLLTSSARSGLGTLPLTHETIAHALGVRRAGITAAMLVFEKSGAVRCTRGQVEILNAKLLETSACECGTCQTIGETRSLLVNTYSDVPNHLRKFAKVSPVEFYNA